MKFLVLALALVLGACTSTNPSPVPVPVPSPTPSANIGCALEQTLAASMANGVATALGCSEPNAIQADLLTSIGKANLCATSGGRKAGGAIGDVVCPIIVNQTSAIALSKVPASWGCGGSVTTDMVKAKLTSLCTTNFKY